MVGSRLSRTLVSQGSVCRHCRATLTAVPVRLQRRWIGLKYQAKVVKAEEEWRESAKQIEAGEKPNLFDILEERGFIKDVAGTREQIRELMRTKRIRAYAGFDPTAPSLHIGHLITLMPLFWMYIYGYGAITLVGGATGKIGDPTDRLSSRDRLSRVEHTVNITKIHYQLKKLWLNVEAQAPRYGFVKEWAWKRAVLNNSAWWGSLPMLEFLKRIGTTLRISPMLSRESVKRKMEGGDGMSFAEFTYPLMQGWDWWHLFKTFKTQLQIGGSDQYGNILTGIEIIKAARANEPEPEKMLPQDDIYCDPVGFTVPLLTDSTGKKLGKSEGNAIWLDKFETPVFDLYGYFVRRPDGDVEQLLKLLTFLPKEKITSIMEEHNADPTQRVAHHLLAFEVTALVHGHKVATQTQLQHRAMYAKDQHQRNAAEQELQQITTKLETDGVITLNNAPKPNMILPESLIMGKSIGRILWAAGFVNSNRDAHRLVTQGGAYIGASPGQPAASNQGMTFGQLQFTPVRAWFPGDTKNFLIDGKMLLLRKGRHNVRIIEMVSDETYEASGQTYPGQPGKGKVRLLLNKLNELKEQGQTTWEGEDGDMQAQTPAEADESDLIDSEDYKGYVDKDPTLVYPTEKSRQVIELEKKIQKAFKKTLLEREEEGEKALGDFEKPSK